MQLIAPLQAIGIMGIGVVLGPWLALGVIGLYFKLVRNGCDLRWFDLPPLADFLVLAFVVTIQAVLLGALIEMLTGHKFKGPIGPEALMRSDKVA